MKLKLKKIAAIAAVVGIGAIAAPNLPPLGTASAHVGHVTSVCVEGQADTEATWSSFPDADNTATLTIDGAPQPDVTWHGTSHSEQLDLTVGTHEVVSTWSADGGGSFDESVNVPDCAPSSASATFTLDCAEGGYPALTATVVVSGPDPGTDLAVVAVIQGVGVMQTTITWASGNYTLALPNFGTPGQTVKVRLTLDGEVTDSAMDFVLPDCAPPPVKTATVTEAYCTAQDVGVIKGTISGYGTVTILANSGDHTFGMAGPLGDGAFTLNVSLTGNGDVPHFADHQNFTVDVFSEDAQTQLGTAGVAMIDFTKCKLEDTTTTAAPPTTEPATTAPATTAPATTAPATTATPTTAAPTTEAPTTTIVDIGTPPTVPPAGLPKTGSNTGGKLAGAAMLVGLGGILLFIRRRRPLIG